MHRFSNVWVVPYQRVLSIQGRRVTASSAGGAKTVFDVQYQRENAKPALVTVTFGQGGAEAANQIAAGAGLTWAPGGMLAIRVSPESSPELRSFMAGKSR